MSRTADTPVAATASRADVSKAVTAKATEPDRIDVERPSGDRASVCCG